MSQSACTCIVRDHDHEAGKCPRFSAAYRGGVCYECHYSRLGNSPAIGDDDEAEAKFLRPIK